MFIMFVPTGIFVLAILHGIHGSDHDSLSQGREGGGGGGGASLLFTFCYYWSSAVYVW